MGIGQTMQSFADLLGSDQGSLVLGIGALLAIAAPVVDRFIIRRKRITFRVLYNSKIGLNPVKLDEGEESKHTDPQWLQVARLLDRMSIVVIRVRNTGSFDIEPEDFEREISFTFGDRVIWDARISEATTEDLRELVRDNMLFFSTENGEPEPSESTQGVSKVRDILRGRLSSMLGTGKAKEEISPQWHGVELTRLSLKRGEKFKLVVVLREPDDNASGEITKGFDRRGRITSGRFKDERKQRRFGWPVITVGTGILLTGALIATLLTNGGSRPVDPTIECASGKLSIEGSSVFAPIMGRIADEYSRACEDADIDTQAIGSLDGVRALVDHDPNAPDELAALSDGTSGAATPALDRQPVAVIMYGVVVNPSTAVGELTTAQLKAIHDGTYTDWNQVRGGPSLPIRIVGRSGASGSRQTYEQAVLRGSEGTLSSDDCETRRPGGEQAPTTLCERSLNEHVIDEVSATPGAIGYADVPAVRAAMANNRPLTVLRLDDRDPDINSIPSGYPFWTVEYLYTKGVPENDSLLKKVIDYLRSGTARDELQSAGYTPCVGKDNSRHILCVR